MLGVAEFLFVHLDRQYVTGQTAKRQDSFVMLHFTGQWSVITVRNLSVDN